MMSIPCAFRRCRPLGAVRVQHRDEVDREPREEPRTGGARPGVRAEVAARGRASALVAVGSSPCICDQRRTLVGPLPSFRTARERPSAERPSSTTEKSPG